MSTDIALRPGEKVKYTLTNFVVTDTKLGRGAFAKVYRGYQNVTKLPVAVKVILSAKKETIDLVQQEIKILKGLDHRHIVRLIETDTVQVWSFFLLLPSLLSPRHFRFQFTFFFCDADE